jgi:hypothetical protein
VDGQIGHPGQRVVVPVHEIDPLMHDKTTFAPIVEPPLLSGASARLAEVPAIAGRPYVSPCEVLKLEPR